MPTITVELQPCPPFRLDLTAWVLKRRPGYVVDGWDGQVYRRVLTVGGEVVDLAARQLGPPDEPRLALTLSGSPAVLREREALVAAFARLTGLNVDLTSFYALAASDALLAPLVDQFRGVKPPRYLNLFECLTNAIACQQVSLVFGLQVVSRLAAAYGLAVERDDGTGHAFPNPKAIATADPEHLRAIGFTRQKARALIELALGLVDGRIELSGLEQTSDDEALARLTALRGVGRWTAEYTLLRGLGRYHIFPGDDVGARNTLGRWLGAEDRLDYDGVRALLRRWHPYAGLLYFHMLLRGIDVRGELESQR